MTSEQRRHIQIPGPFDGYRVGLIDSPITIYDLSAGGCFVNSFSAAPDVGRHVVLKIDLPGEGWICLKSQVMHAKPEFGFAVSFIDVPRDAADRLERGIRRRQGLFQDTEPDSSLVPLSCPRCHNMAVRPLGTAGTSVSWFGCEGCEYSMGAR